MEIHFHGLIFYKIKMNNHIKMETFSIICYFVQGVSATAALFDTYFKSKMDINPGYIFADMNIYNK